MATSPFLKKAGLDMRLCTSSNCDKLTEKAARLTEKKTVSLTRKAVSLTDFYGGDPPSDKNLLEC